MSWSEAPAEKRCYRCGQVARWKQVYDQDEFGIWMVGCWHYVCTVCGFRQSLFHVYWYEWR